MRINPRVANRLVTAGLTFQALFTVSFLILIIVIIFVKGFSNVTTEFIFSYPEDMGRHGGIFPSIISTIFLCLLSIAFATPLGVGTAIYLTEYTRETRMTRALRFGTDCLAGIPSIIFGLFGYILFVVMLGFGWSVISGGLSLAAMILPTIIRTAEEALRSVPRSYRDVAASLGGTPSQVVARSVLPYALPGILTGLILGIGRSIEETAVVIFTAGSAVQMPKSFFDSARTLAVHFYILAREGVSNQNAYATAAVLILTVLVINIVAYTLMHRLMRGRRAV